MSALTRTYFVSDVHLGLQAFDPEDRERRFVAFLHSINNPETEALYMLGDIWDFWYEWKEVVPKGYIRVFAALTDLMDSGVKVYFFCGNHDIWAYSYFEELGMTRLEQPAFVELGGKSLCIGHGDGLGKMDLGYRILNRGIFKCRFLQVLFSALVHPTLVMKLGHFWSRSNRMGHKGEYVWKGEDEALTAYCKDILRTRHVDLFIFGHYHVAVRQNLAPDSELIVLDSWLCRDSVFCIDREAQS